jgi:hypothetical protein
MPETYPRIPARSRASVPLAVTIVTLALLMVSSMCLLAIFNGFYPNHSAKTGGFISAVRASDRSSSGLQAPARAEPLNGNGLQTPAMAAGGSGLFQEADSAREMPEITVTNVETDTMTLAFIDFNGHRYTVSSSNSQLATIQLPPGDYQLEISSSDPGVQTNTGDAVFRKHKQYTATFRHDTDAGPVHLGD